jgi:hypothetical protein
LGYLDLLSPQATIAASKGVKRSKHGTSANRKCVILMILGTLGIIMNLEIGLTLCDIMTGIDQFGSWHQVEV